MFLKLEKSARSAWSYNLTFKGTYYTFRTSTHHSINASHHACSHTPINATATHATFTTTDRTISYRDLLSNFKRFFDQGTWAHTVEGLANFIHEDNRIPFLRTVYRRNSVRSFASVLCRNMTGKLISARVPLQKRGCLRARAIHVWNPTKRYEILKLVRRYVVEWKQIFVISDNLDDKICEVVDGPLKDRLCYC